MKRAVLYGWTGPVFRQEAGRDLSPFGWRCRAVPQARSVEEGGRDAEPAPSATALAVARCSESARLTDDAERRAGGANVVAPV